MTEFEKPFTKNDMEDFQKRGLVREPCDALFPMPYPEGPIRCQEGKGHDGQHKAIKQGESKNVKWYLELEWEVKE